MSTFVFEQIESQGERVTASLTPADRAAEIVAEAHARSVEIEREAHEAGYEAGRAEVIAQAEVEMAAPRAAVLAAVGAVYAAQEELAAAVELRTVELAILIAERILGSALAIRPELVCDVVAGALRRALTRDRLAIDVNPADVDVVRTWLASNSAESGVIEIHAERRVAPGGCVVRTSEGEIDAQFSVQLERAGEVLRQALAGSPGDAGT